MADKIRTLGPGSLVIGADADAYKLDVDCTSVELAPDNSSEDPDNFLDGHEEGGALTTSWKLSGSIGEDYSMTGAQVYCLDHAGELKHAKFIPNTKGSLQLDLDVTIAPIAFGGDVKTRNKKDFEFAATNVKASAYTTAAEGA
ncbi:hypothetical protein [Bifidobacterium cebidarum]|uniref:Phage tail protein n=1 Tax=Bifidobacterium cebidarum TaxID=2650773 RepID=A0A6I1GJ77_9BIFI|nr:hypothetical protein [Bifidobacterium cebidarum]KAB7789459.1 hypothetical protein F7D08_0411 [Bifidobacterium cebidarum]